MTWLKNNRKLVAAAVVTAGATVAVCMHAIESAQYEGLLKLVFGLFVAGNAVEYAAKAVGKNDGTSG